jgi:uncharacterized protein (TIGR02266 family)
MGEENERRQRRAPRVEAVLRVEYDEPEGLHADYLANLSEGGLFIRTAIPFEVGRELAFSLSFPGLLDPLALRCVVRWRRGATPAAQMEIEQGAPERAPLEDGIGVEFLFDGEEQRRAVRSLLASLDERARGGGTQSPLRLLLVEDNEFAVELFLHAIQEAGARRPGAAPIEVLAVGDGAAALQLLEREVVDMAIVDHYLPGVTGCALVRQLRAMERLRQIPVLVVSVGRDEVRALAYASGADLFLDKPVVRRHLVDTIVALLGDRDGRAG